MVASFGKTYHITGWRVGYVLAPEALTERNQKSLPVYRFFCFDSMQHALATFHDNRDAYLQLSDFFQKKRDYFRSMIKESRFTLLPSRGSYFQCATYERITDEADADLAIRLTHEYKVATIPVSAVLPGSYRSSCSEILLRQERRNFGKSCRNIMQDLNISFIQTSIQWEDKEANLLQYSKLIDQITTPTDIILLPEMFNTGFSMNAPKLAEAMEWAFHRLDERNLTYKKCHPYRKPYHSGKQSLFQ
jgi:hypothetical protein